MILQNMTYFASGIIIITGILMMITKKELIKIVMGLSLVEAGVNLFLVATGYITGSAAPIFTNADSDIMSYPVVQAMTLTNIVIGIATTALLLSFIIVIYKKYGTADVDKVRRLRG